MSTRINPLYVRRIEAEIAEFINQQTTLNEITTSALAARLWIAALANHNIVFKVTNLGAGVKRITTDVTNCPCCRQPLKQQP